MFPFVSSCFWLFLVLIIVLLIGTISTFELTSSSSAVASKLIENEPTKSLRYFYTDSARQQSVAFRLLHEDEQQEMQEEILNVLGLNHRPRPQKRVLDESASKYLIDLYTTYMDKDTGEMKEYLDYFGHSDIHSEYSASTSNNKTEKMQLEDLVESDLIISFVNQIKKQRKNKHLRHNRDRRFWFNVSDIESDSVVIDVELRLFRDLQKSRLNSSFPLELTLYQLSYGISKEEVALNFVNSLKIDGHIQGWLKFNVTEPFANWIKYPNQNLGLYLQIRAHSYSGKELSPKAVGLMTNSRLASKQYQPFMTAYIKLSSLATSLNQHRNLRPNELEQSNQRRQRRASTKKRSDMSYYEPDVSNPYLNPQSSTRSCQKRTLYVNFRDLNWQDWIIAPDGYAAFFCDGECSFPLNGRMNATNHAIVQNLIHILNPYNVPKPCCAPTKLEPIMVLFFDDNSNVVLKKYRNMVVKSCGCH